MAGEGQDAELTIRLTVAANNDSLLSPQSNQVTSLSHSPKIPTPGIEPGPPA